MSALKRSRYAGQIPAPLRLRWFEARGGRSPVATPAESETPSFQSLPRPSSSGSPATDGGARRDWRG